MKRLIIAAVICLAATAAQAKVKVYCHGDSINADRGSMCDLLQSDYGHEVVNHSQGGRSFIFSQLPNDLEPSGKWFPKVAIMALGTNDMNTVGTNFFGKSRMNMNTQADMFLNHGYRLIIVVPATYVGYPNITVIQDMLTDYCSHKKWVAGKRVKAECVYADDVWQHSLTRDGIHPTPDLNRILADWMSQIIQNN